MFDWTFRLRRPLFLVAFALASAAFAQVSVPVAVLDGSNQSVSGLQKADFSADCGKSASLDAVEEVPPATLNGFSERVPVFILYDAVAFPRPIQAQLSMHLLSFLRQIAKDRVPVTLLKNNGTAIEIIHDLTIEPGVLAAALDRVASDKEKIQSNAPTELLAGDFQKKVDEAAVALRGLTSTVAYKTPVPSMAREVGPQLGVAGADLRLAGVQQVAKMFQQSRKRKLFVWLTGYFPIEVDHGQVARVGSSYLTWDPYSLCAGSKTQTCNDVYYNPTSTITRSVWGSALQALNEARISLYTMDVRNVTGCCVLTAANPSPKNGLESLARGTGGFSLLSIKGEDLASVIAAPRRQFGAYYVLTITPAPKSKDAWTACKVQVSKPELKAVAPEGFFSARK